MTQEVNRPSVKQIFVAAMKLSDPRAIASYLDDVCGTDGTLRDKVEQLLAARRHDGIDLLDHAVKMAMCNETDVGDASHVVASGPMGRPQVRGYRILEVLGEGGMGVVYLAEQEQPVRRKVALKIIRPGMDSRQVMARFQAERQVLAMMEHPNIAKVFDAGTTDDDRPFIAMELVRGRTITEFCDEHRMKVSRRLELLAKVCRAVQHTHQKGIIHRDLKPSNVMVEMHDGEVVPKIIDFGVAKATQHSLTDETVFTRFVQMIGTPLYMSPEQAELQSQDVDTRSDVYSLGVILYELLTGRTPFDADRLRDVGFDEMRQIIRTEDPPRPSSRLNTLNADDLHTLEQVHGVAVPQIARRLRGELDWIALKALEKDRTRRYDSAAALAQDIESYLEGTPIVARPPSFAYHVSKFASRNKGILAASMAVLIALLVGTAASLWYAWQTRLALDLADQRLADSTAALTSAEQARNAAEDATRHGEMLLYLAHMKLASDAYYAGDIPSVARLLKRHVPGANEEDLRGFEWHFLNQLVEIKPRWRRDVASAVHCVKHSPQGDRIAVAGADGTLQICDSASGAPLVEFTAESIANDISWHPAGQSLATASEDGRIWVFRMPDSEQLAQAKSTQGHDHEAPLRGRPAEQSWRAHEGEANALRYSPDGKTLASAGDDGLIRLWNSVDGRKRFEMAGHQREVESIAWSPAGDVLASASSDATIGLWDVVHGERLNQWAIESPRRGRLVTVAFSPSGKLIAAGDIEGNLVLVQRETGAMTVTPHLDGLESIVFTDNGKRLAAGDRSGAIHVWKIANATSDAPQLVSTETSHWQAHSRRGISLSASARDTLMVSGSLDGKIASWRPPPDTRWRVDTVGEDFANDAHGTLHVCRHEVHRFDLRHDRWAAAMAPSKVPWELMTVSADGKTLALATPGSVSVVHADRGDRIAHWNVDQDPNAIEISPDGQWVAVAWWDQNRQIDLLDVKDPAHQWQLPAQQSECLCFSPDGRYLAVGNLDDILLYDFDQRKLKRQFKGHQSTLSAVAFHPLGHQIATVSDDRLLRTWDVESGQPLHSIEAHRSRVCSVCYSRDGRRIATCGDDGLIQLWHTETIQPLLSIPVGYPLHKVGFSENDRQLVVRLKDGRILVYGASSPADEREHEDVANAGAELIGLGVQPSGEPYQAMNISDDGRIIVGNHAEQGRTVPFRWSRDEGLQSLPVPAAYQFAYVMSADSACDKIAGRFVMSKKANHVGHWIDAASDAIVESLPNGWRQLLVTSQDGPVLGGYGFRQGSQQRAAFYYVDGEFHVLESPATRKNAAVMAMANHGDVVIGIAWSRNGPAQSRATGDLQVVTWHDGTVTTLPGFDMPGYNWRATACSADGTVIVGNRWPVGTTPLEEDGLAFRWLNGSVQTLGELIGGRSQSVAHAVSADGHWVVGSSWTDKGETAFLWDAKGGMRSLVDQLRRQGADVAGWHLTSARAVSEHGSHVVGIGTNPDGLPELFLARIATD